MDFRQRDRYPELQRERPADGLSINPTDGVISGTIAIDAKNGPYTVTVTASTARHGQRVLHLDVTYIVLTDPDSQTTRSGTPSICPCRRPTRAAIP